MVSLLLLLLVFAPPAAPEADAPMLLRDADSVSLMETARAQIFDMRLTDGEATLYRLAARSDGAAAAYYHLATASLLKVLLSDRPAHYDEFFVRSDSLREILGDLRGSVWRDHLLAENDLQRALAWAKKGSYVKAAMAAVGAYRKLRSLASKHPDFVESYKGLGAMHATIGALPTIYRRFLRVFGFEGTLEQGLDELERAAADSKFHREEALVFLGTLDVYGFPSRIDALDSFGSLYAEHPESPLFALLYGDALIKRRRIAEAAEVLGRANVNTDRSTFRVHYADYYLAEAHFRMDDFEAAIPLYRIYLGEHVGPSLKAVGWLHLGEALELSGNRVEAERAYRTVVAAREFDSDAAAARAAKGLLARPLHNRGRTLILARNAFDRSDTDEAVALLQTIIDDAGARPAERGEAWYRMGRTLDESGSPNDAAPFYRQAAAAPGDPMAKWGPFSWYYLGRLHSAAGRIEDAKQAYEQVTSYKGSYDFRGTLEKQAQVALARLGN